MIIKIVSSSLKLIIKTIKKVSVAYATLFSCFPHPALSGVSFLFYTRKIKVEYYIWQISKANPHQRYYYYNHHQLT